mmetsp:Transcript_44318/g.87241  ORF Transcript_44318/g.87241 Transcript_44318/m.87241 type:complete len:342 (-) Transcript_44318:140-1165(-)
MGDFIENDLPDFLMEELDVLFPSSMQQPNMPEIERGVSSSHPSNTVAPPLMPPTDSWGQKRSKQDSGQTFTPAPPFFSMGDPGQPLRQQQCQKISKGGRSKKGGEGYDRVALRRERNRIQAKLCRQRRKGLQQDMKLQFEDLQAENASLRRYLSDRIGDSELANLLMPVNATELPAASQEDNTRNQTQFSSFFELLNDDGEEEDKDEENAGGESTTPAGQIGPEDIVKNFRFMARTGNLLRAFGIPPTVLPSMPQPPAAPNELPSATCTSTLGASTTTVLSSAASSSATLESLLSPQSPLPPWGDFSDDSSVRTGATGDCGYEKSVENSVASYDRISQVVG